MASMAYSAKSSAMSRALGATRAQPPQRCVAPSSAARRRLTPSAPVRVARALHRIPTTPKCKGLKRRKSYCAPVAATNGSPESETPGRKKGGDRESQGPDAIVASSNGNHGSEQGEATSPAETVDAKATLAKGEDAGALAYSGNGSKPVAELSESEKKERVKQMQQELEGKVQQFESSAAKLVAAVKADKEKQPDERKRRWAKLKGSSKGEHLVVAAQQALAAGFVRLIAEDYRQWTTKPCGKRETTGSLTASSESVEQAAS